MIEGQTRSKGYRVKGGIKEASKDRLSKTFEEASEGGGGEIIKKTAGENVGGDNPLQINFLKVSDSSRQRIKRGIWRFSPPHRGLLSSGGSTYI